MCHAQCDRDVSGLHLNLVPFHPVVHGIRHERRDALRKCEAPAAVPQIDPGCAAVGELLPARCNGAILAKKRSDDQQES